MSLQDSVISLAAKVLSVISLKKVAVWTFAAIVVLIGFTVFQNRIKIYAAITSVPVVETPSTVSPYYVSQTSQDRLKLLVDADDLISSIIVLNADLRNNRRIPIYWYSDDPYAQKTLDTLFVSKFGIPLFTAEEKNNSNMVGIINGEFACNLYAEGNSGLFPGLGQRMPTICRASLPPYYGQFSGFLTISLNRVPTTDEVIALKSTMLAVATEIYFRDVVPANKSLNAIQ